MKTVILYATKHGATKKCAEKLAQMLAEKVEIYSLKESNLPDLAQYDKVIIGSSIYVGKVHKEVTEYCARNLNILKAKKIGLYICCMNKGEAEKQLNSAFPLELLNCASAKDSFGGEFIFGEMSFMEKLVTKMVSKMLAKEDKSLVIDTKKDISLLSEEKIYNFAKLMN